MLAQILLAGTVAFLLGCGGSQDGLSESSSTNEIVRGALDRGRDPAVVAIDVDGEGLCSGSLISPNVVLTARHCVSFSAHAVSCPPAGVQVGNTRDPNSLSILVGGDIRTAKRRAHGHKIVTPPGDALCDSDIALVVLDQKIDDIVPLEASRKTLRKDALLLAVGFGLTGSSGSGGTKRARKHVPILERTAREFVVGESTCQGDSGGPAIDEATGQVVGVVSRGSTCNGTLARNVYTRVDAFRDLLRLAGL